MSAPVFISYASKDRKVAEALCNELENRGFACWIAGRNVAPGENFQEAIVRAIRTAKVMVLIFTRNANDSAEIRKELVIAGQHNLSIVPVRIEDVAPSDALAYEFATRQWIDMFEDRNQAVERLSGWIAARVPPQAASVAVGGRDVDAGAPAAVGRATIPVARTDPAARGPGRPRSAIATAHRVAGIVLYIGTVLVACWLIAISRGAESYAPVQAFLDSIVGRALLVVYTVALAFHMLNGVRCLIGAVGIPLPQSNPLLIWYQRVTAVANVPLTVAFAAILVVSLGRTHAQTVELLRRQFVALLMILFTVSVVAHMRIGMELVIEDSMRGDLWRPLVLMANTFCAVAVGLACIYAILLLSFGA